jgi:hypothetical protein
MAMNMLFESMKRIPEPIRYNPHRDLAYGNASLLKHAEKITLSRRWKKLNEMQDKENVTEEDLANAWKAVALFMNEAQEDFETPVQDLLKKVGWFDVNDAAQVAVCAAIGRIMIGAFHTAIQETTRNDAVPALTNEEIAERAYQLHQALSPAWWEKGLTWIRNLLRNGTRWR